MKRFGLRPEVFALAIALLALSTPAVLAAGADVAAEGETRTEPCNGAAATVSGNHNTVTFTGACASLTVRGEANRISVGVANGAPIDVQGGRNMLRITAGKPGKLLVSGSNTSVVAAGGTPPPADGARMSGDYQSIELSCADQAVTLEGSRSRFVLRGGCRALSVSGGGNKVDAELLPAAKVSIDGDGIIVTFRLKGSGPQPVASVIGVGSVFEADSQVPQGQAPPAPPAGIARVAWLMHDLQGAVVLDGTLVRLPADQFAGNTLGPNAEATMVKLAALIVQIQPKGLRIQGADPVDPSLAGSRAGAVQAWLAQRAQMTLPVQAAGARGDAAQVDVTMLR